MRRLCRGGACRGFIPLGRGRQSGAQIDVPVSRPGKVNNAGKTARGPGESRLKVKLQDLRRAELAVSIRPQQFGLAVRP